jgi:hypothetical protein
MVKMRVTCRGVAPAAASSPWRPTGAEPKTRDTLLSCFPRIPAGDGRGNRRKRGEAASTQSKPAISAPHRQFGAEMSRN